MDDVEPSGSGNLIIPIERVPVAAFQAIYHNLTRKTDFLRKKYDNAVYLTIESITDLHYHIVQTMSQYGVRSNSSRVIFSLLNGETLDISSVEMFTAANWRAFTAQSQSISITYDYLIMRPVEVIEAEDVSQRFRVKVDASPSRELLDDGFFIGVGSNGFPARDKLRLSSEIEYSDIAISRSLQTVINDWVDRHSVTQAETISEARSFQLRKHIGYIAPSAAFFVFASSLFLEFGSYKNLLTPIRYLFVVVSACLGVSIVTSFASDYLKSTLRKLENKLVLNLTTGDARIMQADLESRASAKGKIKYAVGTVIMSVLLGLLVNYASVYLLPNG